jgi:hypothetical protein
MTGRTDCLQAIARQRIQLAEWSIALASPAPA